MAAITVPVSAEATPTLADLRYRLSIDRYHRLVGSGVFSEGEPLILWEGQLVTKMTKNPPHAVCQGKLFPLLLQVVPDGWHARQESPVILGDDSLPEPDLTVIRGAVGDHPDRHPSAREIVLLVEVSDSSLAIDRGEMLRAYAGAGIPVYWIVNLRDRRIEVYTEPSGAADPPFYRSARIHGPEDEVAVVLEGRDVGRIAVRDVLP